MKDAQSRTLKAPMSNTRIYIIVQSRVQLHGGNDDDDDDDEDEII